MNWQHQVDFGLSNYLLLSNIKFQDQIFEQATMAEIEPKQKCYANFLIMTKTLSKLFEDLLKTVITRQTKKLTTKTTLA